MFGGCTLESTMLGPTDAVHELRNVLWFLRGSLHCIYKYCHPKSRLVHPLLIYFASYNLEVKQAGMKCRSKLIAFSS